uniref:BAG domain-containing protein n=1 Tax=Salix viminalis TaxID=40686 RepID=A0A6N2KCC5_SALVM
MVLVEDPISQEKRFLEMRKNAKMEKASKSISEISLDVDRLAGQVSAFESVITKGGKVAEKSVLNLIELLMNQLVKLDGILVDGDAKLQRKTQVKRVQKYVETLDMLKMKNSMPNGNAADEVKDSMPNGNGHHAPMQQQQQQQKHSNGQKVASIQKRQPRRRRAATLVRAFFVPSTTAAVRRGIQLIVTTQWETFDSTPASEPAPSASTFSTATKTPAHQPKFPWDLFN